MSKSGKSSSSGALDFGTGEKLFETSGINELNWTDMRSSITYGSSARLNGGRWNVLLQTTSTRQKIKLFREKIKIFGTNFEEKFRGKEIPAVNQGFAAVHPEFKYQSLRTRSSPSLQIYSRR